MWGKSYWEAKSANWVKKIEVCWLIYLPLKFPYKWNTLYCYHCLIPSSLFYCANLNEIEVEINDDENVVTSKIKEISTQFLCHDVIARHCLSLVFCAGYLYRCYQIRKIHCEFSIFSWSARLKIVVNTQCITG